MEGEALMAEIIADAWERKMLALADCDARDANGSEAGDGADGGRTVPAPLPYED